MDEIEIINDENNKDVLKILEVRGKKFDLPIFLPDATKGYIKSTSIEDVKASGINGLVVNTFHLLSDKLIANVEAKGGIHKYMNFDGLVISDSGGFQAMSLVRDFNKTVQKHTGKEAVGEYGKIDDGGVSFFYDDQKIRLTPENCIKLQFLIGSDIIMCLDDCTRVEEEYSEQEKSVQRTIDWAKRCKDEYERIVRDMDLSESRRPLIFGIIQGGNYKELRKKCADELVKIGFDGYAYGGFPVNESGEFLSEILEYVASLMPNEKAKYAMGIGKPEDIVKCVKYGYSMFDCVIPTREARNNRLYSFKGGFLGLGLKKLDEKGDFYEYVRVRNLDNKDDKKPISKKCDCYTCKNYNRSDLYKLFRENTSQAFRLASIHNLRFYVVLMERLRKDGK